MKLRSLATSVLICGLAMLTYLQPRASADAHIQWHPFGPQSSDFPLPPTYQSGGLFVSAVSQFGLDTLSGFDVWPVGYIDSSSIDLGSYVSLTVGSIDGRRLPWKDMVYTKLSYTGTGATAASVRTGKDGFTNDVDTLVVNPGGSQILHFDLRNRTVLPRVRGLLEFRIYFYGAQPGFPDRDDLVDLKMNSVPEPGSVALLICGGIACAMFAIRRRHK